MDIAVLEERQRIYLDATFCATLPTLIVISMAHKGVTVELRPQVHYLKSHPTLILMDDHRIYLLFSESLYTNVMLLGKYFEQVKTNYETQSIGARGIAILAF